MSSFLASFVLCGFIAHGVRLNRVKVEQSNGLSLARLNPDARRLMNDLRICSQSSKEHVQRMCDACATNRRHCASYDTFDFEKARPECKLEARDQKLCGNCWAWAATRVFGERMCVATNGASLMRPSSFQLDDCSEQKGVADDKQKGTAFYMCTGGNPKLAYQYLKSKGAVTEAIYGGRDYSTWQYIKVGFQYEAGLAQCRLAESRDSESTVGYLSRDPRKDLQKKSKNHNAYEVADKEKVFVPPFLFSADTRICIQRPFYRRLAVGGLVGAMYAKRDAHHGQFHEETPLETVEFIREVQDEVLREGPGVAHFIKIKGREFEQVGHDMTLHGWELRDDTFVWLMKNSWGEGGDKNKGKLNSFEPDSNGHTYVAEPNTLECVDCEHYVLLEVCPIQPEVPGTRDSTNRYIMPNHHITAQLEAEGERLRITAQLGDYDREEGGSGKGVSTWGARGKNVWASTLKFRVQVTFTSFSDGKTRLITTMDQDSGAVFTTTLGKTQFNFRGIASISLLIASKSSNKYDLYTTKDLVLTFFGNSSLSLLDFDAFKVTPQSAAIFRRWISSSAPTAARKWGTFWTSIHLSIDVPTDMSASTLSGLSSDHPKIYLTSIISCIPVLTKGWRDTECNGFQITLPGKKPKKPISYVVCTASEKATGLHDFFEQLQYAIKFAGASESQR